jgi:hypothetical protein
MLHARSSLAALHLLGYCSLGQPSHPYSCMRTQLIALCLLMATAGAAPAPAGDFVGLGPDELQPAMGPRTVALGQSISWHRANRTEVGLLPASYSANWQSAEGQFYLADKPAVYMRSVRGLYMVVQGGVLLPNAPAARPRIFLVQDSTVRRGATLAEAIADTPREPTVLPLVDALLNWASKGHVVLLAEIDDVDVSAKVRVAFSGP